jgi:hypothetical protein
MLNEQFVTVMLFRKFYGALRELVSVRPTGMLDPVAEAAE